MNAPLDRQLAYLRLARTDQIGPVTFQRLLSVYGSPEKAFAALPELSQRGGRKRPLKAFSMSKAARFSPCQTRRLMRGVSARIIYCAMAR